MNGSVVRVRYLTIVVQMDCDPPYAGTFNVTHRQGGLVGQVTLKSNLPNRRGLFAWTPAPVPPASPPASMPGDLVQPAPGV